MSIEIKVIDAGVDSDEMEAIAEKISSEIEKAGGMAHFIGKQIMMGLLAIITVGTKEEALKGLELFAKDARINIDTVFAAKAKKMN